MTSVWTLLAVGVYLTGRLGPDGVVTGTVAETAILIAIISQAGFAFISWVEKRKTAQPVTRNE